jgi:hypothetical protein
MTGSLHEQFERPELPLPSDRSTGLVFATVALLIAYLWRSHTPTLVVAIGLAGALFVVSFVAPSILRPFNIAWMRFAHLLSRVVNPIVMLVLFAVAIIPTGLIMQLMRDPLRRRKVAADTHWIAIKATERADQSSMRNQF